MNLNSKKVSALNDAAKFVQRLAEEVAEFGGNLDEIMDTFNSSNSLPRHKVANALMSLVIRSVTEEPFKIVPSTELLEELVKGLVPNAVSKKYFLKIWEDICSQQLTEPGLFHIFEPRYSMSFEQIYQYMGSCGFLIPTVREFASIPEPILKRIAMQTLSKHTVYLPPTKNPAVRLSCWKGENSPLMCGFGWETNFHTIVHPGDYFVVKLRYED